ncbi:probable L-gulonolactone oxidase 6 [Olea europaea subsp. europaea]|uniref:Probable L-gulonolactone oxidase 6 n=1 Tax=Olea europaea subsp. europaea TaxID=158383 RepID=A0A8S0QLC8_OLEEU|nr:probable L-gulonolactone oxidase 6 [Olea europaea subsp. europaea]
MKHLQSKKNVIAKCMFFIMIISMVNCSPPEDPIKCTINNCNCTITNTYGAFPDRSICRAAKVVYPIIEEELISAVANATKTNTRMKVATRISHSIPKLVCPKGDNGLLISTKYLNRTLDVNVSSMMMTVENGMTLRQLINDAAKVKLAGPYSPYWWGLTIGEMMGFSYLGPPEDPIKCTINNCNCTITNTYGAFPDRSICRAAKVVYPIIEEELISAVSNATKTNTRMKVATRISHSIPKLVCPKGDNGLLISTKYLNRTLDVNVSSMMMTVENGMTLRRLINDAAKVKLARPYSPYWWGLTIGEMMGTGAHGSSLWGLGSQVHDYVIRLWIATPATAEEGYATVRTLEIGNPELDAAKVSLGVQVISQVILKSQPLFKRSVVQHEYADFMWHPSQKQVVYRIDHRVPFNTSGNEGMDFSIFQVFVLRLQYFYQHLNSFHKFLRKCLIEETEELLGDAHGKCRSGKRTTSILKTTAYGLANNDVQKLVALEPKSMCGLDLYSGILMRYVTASTAYLGKQEDALDFDITYYRSKDPMNPRLYEDVLEEIEQIAMFKNGALPHWGKNRNVAFDGAIKKYRNTSEFLKVKNQYDPQGLFSSSWTDQILGLNGAAAVNVPDELLSFNETSDFYFLSKLEMSSRGVERERLRDGTLALQMEGVHWLRREAFGLAIGFGGKWISIWALGEIGWGTGCHYS